MGIDIVSSLIAATMLSIKLFVVIVVLMILYEFYERSKLFELTQKYAKTPMEALGISTNASITMVVGFVLGITYGAGILIKNAMENKMSHKDTVLSAIFLSICHAVIEDTLIFVAVGANGFILFGIRFVLAITVIIMLQRFLYKSSK
ncbi:MAG: nucleoside recognition protein [Calditerrivibrio sp.]|nr:nucleoside recognition protein [Calditerrivibrio sp.]